MNTNHMVSLTTQTLLWSHIVSKKLKQNYWHFYFYFLNFDTNKGDPLLHEESQTTKRPASSSQAQRENLLACLILRWLELHLEFELKNRNWNKQVEAIVARGQLSLQ
jgi:hypothetical protein